MGLRAAYRLVEQDYPWLRQGWSRAAGRRLLTVRTAWFTPGVRPGTAICDFHLATTSANVWHFARDRPVILPAFGLKPPIRQDRSESPFVMTPLSCCDPEAVLKCLRPRGWFPTSGVPSPHRANAAEEPWDERESRDLRTQ